MFVQVIKGRARDAAAFKAQGQRWRDEVRPGAAGFLGSTFEASEHDERPVVRDPQEEYLALFGEMTFVDLRDVLLTGPA
jgi:hypothetical protein